MRLWNWQCPVKVEECSLMVEGLIKQAEERVGYQAASINLTIVKYYGLTLHLSYNLESHNGSSTPLSLFSYRAMTKSRSERRFR